MNKASYKMTRFVIFTLHQILLGLWDRE